jgi:tetratricopeptide (TPR) repeat protein
MKTIHRLSAVAVFCSSALTWSAPPPPPTSLPAPAAPKLTATVTADYPLSCKAPARATVFQAWDALANSRIDEARESLKVAVAADPTCVMARASLGTLTSGPEGKKLFDEAVKDINSLNEIERLDLEAMQANRNADPERAFSLAQQLAAKAPNVFIVNLTVAHYAMDVERWDEAVSASKKATELSPTNGAGWNLLGYARLRQERTDEAVKAFRHYVELAPNEPNAHDSLADALLANGQLDDAATEYQRAIDSSAGKFWYSYNGIASVKAIEGDWAGARDALARQRVAAPRPADKVKTQFMTAWTWVAEGKVPEAIKTLDQTTKEATAEKLDGLVARTAVLKGQLNLAGGKYADALKAFTVADQAKVDALTDGQKKEHRGLVLAGLTEAQARLGKVAEAEKTLGRLDEFVRGNLTGPMAKDAMAFTRGVVSLAKNDPKQAVESLKMCSSFFDYCRMTLADAQERAGDTTGATFTRSALLKANHRDPEYWFVRARIAKLIKGPAM